MLLDLTKLKGPREHVERTLRPSLFEPPDEDYRVVEPVELSMDIEKAGGEGFRVTGKYRTRLELECGRCLEAFQMALESEFDVRYLAASDNTGEGEHEIAEDDLEVAYYRDGALDLIDLLREQFQLALPMKPLCSDACRGLCPECGANLNRTECGCAPKWEDPRLAPLKGLLTPDKEN
jgi:uncharacterized protein